MTVKRIDIRADELDVDVVGTTQGIESIIHDHSNGVYGTPSGLIRLNNGRWTPAEISTSLWLDAADTSPANIIQSGGLVSQWTDKSGNGNNATEVQASKQPITNARTIGGLNAIDLDGIDDRMLFTNVACFGKTIFIVMESDSKAAVTMVLGGNGLNNQFKYFTSEFLAYASVDPVYTANPGSVPNQATVNTPNIVSLVFDNASGQLGVNGAYASGVGTVQAYTNGDQFGQIGAIGAAALGTGFFDGLIGEIIIYDGTDQVTLSEIDSYLSRKWNITL